MGYSERYDQIFYRWNLPKFFNLHDILLYIRRGTSKLSELVSDPVELFNEICSKQKKTDENYNW